MQRHPRRNAHEAGYSIIETVVGAAVIAAGILGLMSLTPVSSDNMVASASTTTALTLATQKIEELKNAPFPPAVAADPPQTVKGVTYTRISTVNTTGTAPNRVASISVTVTWPGRAGSVVLTTVVSE
jgi:Tfp pilus assembly protein PilV